jgi:ABC transporter substrate binding protein (PQQ-dependent alcohol dehydrogenase system)
VFFIEPSDAMYAAAARVAGTANIVTWHSTLERYGAAQLNDRFRSATGRQMDGAAWCGWFATKVVLESSLRMRGKGAAGLREHLIADDTQFDGHKGAPLSFRASDHQLREPVYSLVPGKPPQDIPDFARSPGTARDLLDTIQNPSTACGAS